jgi:CRP-like cAMP-binding protein
MDDLYQKIRAKFPYLTEDKIMAVLSLGEVIMLDEGEKFLKKGDWSQKVGWVLQGLLRNYIHNDKGEEITVVFATEMQAIAAYAPIFLNQASNETAEAIEPSILFSVDYKKFKSNIGTDPDMMRVYVDILETALVATIQRIEDFTNNKPEQRYQRLLDTHGFLIERVPLKYLASYLGITAVSLSRIRKRLTPKRN